jgi:hypothetical protein
LKKAIPGLPVVLNELGLLIGLVDLVPMLVVFTSIAILCGILLYCSYKRSRLQRKVKGRYFALKFKNASSQEQCLIKAL